MTVTSFFFINYLLKAGTPYERAVCLLFQYFYTLSIKFFIFLKKIKLILSITLYTGRCKEQFPRFLHNYLLKRAGRDDFAVRSFFYIKLQFIGELGSAARNPRGTGDGGRVSTNKPLRSYRFSLRHFLACRLGRCFCLRQRSPPETRTPVPCPTGAA